MSSSEQEDIILNSYGSSSYFASGRVIWILFISEPIKKNSIFYTLARFINNNISNIENLGTIKLFRGF